MKIPSLLLACCLAFAALLSPPAALPARAAEEVTFDIFYNSLADEGDWYNTPEFGYVWQPYVAYQNDAWRPYTDGYWAQTDAGWTWVSYENFGWATYHYGRWTQLETTGWVWVPGYEWGPGWVSWRQNDSYVGWAPIPPRRHHRPASNGGVDVTVTGGERVYEPPVSAITSVDYGDVEEDYDVGYNAAVDETCDIGPAHYCFVPVASFGAPYVREVIVPPNQNIIIIENTANVTNIVYRRGYGGSRLIYNGGPDYVILSRRTQRPIPRLLLDRRTDVTVTSLRGRGNQPLNFVNGNRLQVTAPVLARRQVNFTQVRPQRVRQDLTQVREIHGWRNAGGDPQTVQRVRNRIQQEARQAPPARTVAERQPAPTEFRPDNAPAGGPGQQNPVGANGFVAPGGNNNPAVVNPNGRGAADEAERVARRDAQLREQNARRAARGLPPLQPNNPQQAGAGAQQPPAGGVAPQTREQQRAAQMEQQRENQQAAQAQRQQAAQQQRQQQQQAGEARRQQQEAAVEQRRQQQQAAGEQRRQQQESAQQQRQQQQQQEATRQQRRQQQLDEQRANRGGGEGQPRTEAREGGGGQDAAARQQAAADAARARQEARAQQQGRAQEQQQAAAAARAERQQQAQGAARERAEGARQQQQAAAGEERRAAAERAAAERQQAAGAAAERQRAGAEARQQQAAQARQAQGEAQARAREQQQQQAAQQQQQRQRPPQERQQENKGETRREGNRRPEGQPTPQ